MNDDPTVLIGSKDSLLTESYVSRDDEKGYVRITWGTETGTLTPSEARAFALRVMRAAECAETDEFIFAWLAERVNVKGFGDRLKVLRDFRAKRDERDEADRAVLQDPGVKSER